jgi:hypothetical protein
MTQGLQWVMNPLGPPTRMASGNCSMSEERGIGVD